MLVMTSGMSLTDRALYMHFTFLNVYLVSHFFQLSLTIFGLVTLAKCDFLGFLGHFRLIHVSN